MFCTKLETMMMMMMLIEVFCASSVCVDMYMALSITFTPKMIIYQNVPLSEAIAFKGMSLSTLNIHKNRYAHFECVKLEHFFTPEHIFAHSKWIDIRLNFCIAIPF